MSTVDNFIALKVLYMLVTPFDKTEAYKLGVIDKEGKLLVKQRDQTPEQKNAYDYLDRLVFNLKRIIARIPGGKSTFGSIVTALYLIKENYNAKLTEKQLQEQFDMIFNKIELNNMSLVEEEILVEEFLELYNEDGGVAAVPANVTGHAVSTDIPTIRTGKKGRRFGTFHVEAETLAKFAKGKKKFSKWSDYLDLNNPKHAEIYNYAKKNPKGVLILKNGEQQRAIRYNKNGGGKWHKIARRGKPVQMIQVEEL